MKRIDILSLARPNVTRLRPYSSARDDFQGNASVFLDANENPFPTGYNRYPDPHQRILKQVIAREKNLKEEQIFLGNGSDEAIDLLFRVFCEPGQSSTVIPQPTYGMYAVSADVNDVTAISSTLTPTFDLDAKVVLNAVTEKTKIIFLCSPNNPSGNLLKQKEIEIILESFGGIVVVDEAYIDFSKTSSWTTRLEEFPNLVVLQTLSKAWGLAGLRLGMCFANAEVISLLNKIKPPYNINAFTQTEALDALLNKKEKKKAAVEKIIKEREALREALQPLKKVKTIYPSDANFLLVKIAEAKNIYQLLVQQGIVVRDRSNVVLCNDCLRITVGTTEENNKLIQALRQL